MMTATPDRASAPEREVDLKNPWLAAGLALLVPGLGHLYQGRTFKAAIYCVCILGLFFTGQALGEWKVVYLSDSQSSGRLSFGPPGALVGRLLDNYLAQFPAGAAAWPAIVQSRRYNSQPQGDRVRIEEAFSAPFEGDIWIDTAHVGPQTLVELEGTVFLEQRGMAVVGRFEGKAGDGREVRLDFRRVVELGQEISAADYRSVRAALEEVPAWVTVPEGEDIPAEAEPYLRGGIERPFWDWYQVPLGHEGENALTARLGSTASIAWMMTWIAGLLNVLAIWDALDGPAYGYGTEEKSRRKRRQKKDASDEEPARSDEARETVGPSAS